MLILKLLSEEDLYGYEMATLLNTISNHEITFNAGNMYPALYRLEEKGFITKRKEKVGKRVEFIYYHITDSGLSPFSVVVLGNFRRFFSSLFSFLLPSLDFSFIYNKFLMPFRGFFYWKNFFDML